MVHLINTVQEWGQLSTCNDILTCANEYVDIVVLKSSFVGDDPGKDWYYGFLKHWNSDWKLMRSSSLENTRDKGVTEEITNRWFDLLYKVLKTLDLFDKAQNIFNMDKSGYYEESGRSVVLVKRDTKFANQ